MTEKVTELAEVKGKKEVTWNQRSLVIGGEPFLGIGFAVHYWRNDPQNWERIMQRAKENGCNFVETYVFWGLHEKKRGVYDFSGWLDLIRFLEIAKAKQHHVILRIGPYICAEVSYGGFPLWLRDVPDVQMRTNNVPFKEEMSKWVVHLVDLLRLHGLFYPDGPIIAIQLENEYANVAPNYGEDAEGYLAWVGELAQGLNLDIPCIMCHGGPPGVLNTLNAFYPHELLKRHFKEHPEQCAFSTELWSSWYETWGYGLPVRSPEDLAYAAARFFAGGGTGVNYYMGIGGVNVRNSGMFLQPPAYYGDALLDIHGLPTTKNFHLTRLHTQLLIHAEKLLRGRQTVVNIGPDNLLQMVMFTYQGKKVAFLCNDATEPQTAQLWGHDFILSPRSVQIIDSSGAMTFDTSKVASEAQVHRAMRPAEGKLQIFYRQEPRPTLWPKTIEPAAVVAVPEDQLKYTQGETPFCWYSTKLVVSGPEDKLVCGNLILEKVSDLFYIFVDGELVVRHSCPSAPLAENLGNLESEAFRRVCNLHLGVGEHTLEILCCSLGLPKGDWQMGNQNMVKVRAGLWGPVVWQQQDGSFVPESWEIRPGLLDCQKCGDPFYSQWFWVDNTTCFTPLTMIKVRFRKPAQNGPLALDLGSLNQGIFWLNQPDQWLMYWLTPAIAEGDQWLKKAISRTGMGEPTERYYPLPPSWLQDGENEVTIFEVVGGNPHGIKICRREKE